MGVTGRRAARHRAREARHTPTEVTVDVERLVLEGFGRLDATRVSDGLEEDLARLIRRGVPDRWRASSSVENVDAAPIELSLGASGQEVGRVVADAVHAMLEAPNESRR
jgi:hypothetical protein